MSDPHNIITALMTNQSADGVEMIKNAIAKRTELAIQNFVSNFEYASSPEEDREEEIDDASK